ncbi:MAG: TIGR02281 family clan AA aspartic protease [Hyphomonadaceae bacterium]|nr:TIGR02281 family clan AA aspartic protease [Hyphomonadaceae bacterium]
MKTSHIITTFLLAAGVSAVIGLYLDPKLEAEPATEAAAPAAAAPSVASLAVEEPTTSIRRKATIYNRADGHYWTRALVNKKSSVEFMVDTGASVVALTYKDAQKMGLRPDQLDYRWEIRTAGGKTMGASVLVDTIQIGQVKVKNVEAMVLRNDLEQSLLGMSFLRELYSYEFRGERLIIQQ